jgi:hypothetical protein
VPDLQSCEITLRGFLNRFYACISSVSIPHIFSCRSLCYLSILWHSSSMSLPDVYSLLYSKCIATIDGRRLLLPR